MSRASPAEAIAARVATAILCDERVYEACKIKEKVSKVTSVLLLIEKAPSILRIENYARAKLGPPGALGKKVTRQYSPRLLVQGGANVFLRSGSFRMRPGTWALWKLSAARLQ